MLRTFVLLFLLLTTHVVFAQIQTDRLNLNATAQLVKKGQWQVESGLQYEGITKGNLIQNKLISPCVQQRYGLSERIELRLNLVMASSFSRRKPSLLANDYRNGFDAPHIGAKILLAKNKKWLPAISVLPQVGIRPLASRAYQSKRWVPNLDILFSHALPKDFLFGYNLGGFWDDYFNYTGNIYLQKNWNNKILVSAEYEGLWSQPNEMNRTTANKFFASCGFYPGKNALVDFGIGAGIESEPDYFFRAGVSFRLRN